LQVDTQHLLYGCTKLRDGTSLALEKNKVTAESVRGVLQQMYPKAPSAGIGSMFGQQAKVRRPIGKHALRISPAYDQ
jgi:hypothetical protein